MSKDGRKKVLIVLCISIIFSFLGYFFVSFKNEAQVKGVLDLPERFRGGDVDEDGKVSMSDFGIWLNGYRDFKWRAIYTERLDLNGNNKIEMSDFGSWLYVYRGYKEWVLNPPPLYSIKVLSLAYYPINAEGMLDTTIADNSWGEYSMSLEEVRAKVADLKSGLEATLENGTKYHGYSNPNAVQSIDYIVYQDIEYLEAVPADHNKMYNSTHYFTDYNAIMDRVNICDLVDNQGVRAVWIWSYTGIDRLGSESNMSGPYGDISNSDRDTTDLPVCDHTYIVYELNYGRDVACATESHMHQLESVFNHLDSYLFEIEFSGQGGDYSSIPSSPIKRCGNVHFPPNGESDYDYSNTSYVETDCMDWKPDARAVSIVNSVITWDRSTLGEISTINCEQWGCNHRQWFEFWMQNMPGYNNGLTYFSNIMPNWWSLIADLDTALENRYIVQLPSTLPTSPLVAHWSLDNLNDSSGNGYSIMALDAEGESTLDSVVGVSGNAANFSKPVEDKYRLSVIDRWSPLYSHLKPESFTIMAYVKRNDTACNYNYCAIFSKGSSGSQGYSFGVLNNKVHLRINDNQNTSATGMTEFQNNNWYHVAGTYDAGTGSLKVYVNGILDGSSTDLGPINYGGADVVIGNANDGYDLPFRGVIDEVKFFDRALTPQEIINYGDIP